MEEINDLLDNNKSFNGRGETLGRRKRNSNGTARLGTNQGYRFNANGGGTMVQKRTNKSLKPSEFMMIRGKLRRRHNTREQADVLLK